MDTKFLEKYVNSKIHPKIKPGKVFFDFNFKRGGILHEKNKEYNFMRPVLIDENVLSLPPGEDYAYHYKKLYEERGFSVEFLTKPRSQEIQSYLETVSLPEHDISVFGYVDCFEVELTNKTSLVDWEIISIAGFSVCLIGVKYSYWGDLAYYTAKTLIENKTKHLLYLGKLGSLNTNAVPNQTLAVATSTFVDGEEIVINNNFLSDEVLILSGKHYTLPSMLDETEAWFEANKREYSFVDPEIGWFAKCAKDLNINFSNLHIISDVLYSDYEENLSNEPDRIRVKKVLKLSVLEYLYSQKSIGKVINQAQQKRVDKGILPPLERNWEKALSFSYHTAEEAMELVRELPRREWKDQEVIPEQVLAEGADVLIQLYTAMFYAGFSEEDLLKAVRDKLSVKRKDWKS
jgi:hypothetical protein